MVEELLYGWRQVGRADIVAAERRRSPISSRSAEAAAGTVIEESWWGTSEGERSVEGVEGQGDLSLRR